MSQNVIKRISQQELESYLWGAAVLLRGLIDAGDYKQFILANGANLSIPLYVKRQSAVSASNEDMQPATLQAAWEHWQADSRPFWQQMDALVETLDGLLNQENQA